MAEVAFIDLEASGLGANSWPIEVGWGWPDGEPRAYLINPSDDWPEAAWDPRAEDLHKIPLQELRDSGEPIEEICAALNKDLTGLTVYSDAPDWDAFWLYRLFQAGGVRQAFKLTDFREAFVGMASERMSEIIKKADAIAPHIHRAAPDVRHMQVLFDLAKTA